MAKYCIKYTLEALKDIELLKKSGDKSTLKKLSILLKELANEPRKGTGKPEILKYMPKCWSRRISDKHRLIYEIKDDIVTVVVISAYGHYYDK